MWSLGFGRLWSSISSNSKTGNSSTALIPRSTRCGICIQKENIRTYQTYLIKYGMWQTRQSKLQNDIIIWFGYIILNNHKSGFHKKIFVTWGKYFLKIPLYFLSLNTQTEEFQIFDVQELRENFNHFLVRNNQQLSSFHPNWEEYKPDAWPFN